MPLWYNSRMQRHTWFVIQEKRWSRHQTQRSQRNYLARNETSKIPASKEPTGLLRTDGKRPYGVTLIPWMHGKCLAWDVTMPDKFAASHLSTTAFESWISRRIVSHAEDPKVCQHRADSYLHTGRHGDVWCIKHSSERTTHRTRKKNLRDHRRSERNYLPLPASVSCNTT